MGVTLAGPDAPVVCTSLTARALGPQVGLELPDTPTRDKSLVGVVYVTCQRVLWVREGVAGTGLDAGDTASVPLAAVVQIDPHKWSLFASKTPRVRLLVNLDDAATPTTSPLHAVRSAAVTFAFRRVPAKVTPLLTSASSREILTSPRPLAPTTHNECPLLLAEAPLRTPRSSRSRSQRCDNAPTPSLTCLPPVWPWPWQRAPCRLLQTGLATAALSSTHRTLWYVVSADSLPNCAVFPSIAIRKSIPALH